MLTHFDASTVRESERFSYWHEEICRNFCRAETTPVRPGAFNAHLSRTSLGCIQLSHIDCEPLRYERASADVRPSLYGVFMPFNFFIDSSRRANGRGV